MKQWVGVHPCQRVRVQLTEAGTRHLENERALEMEVSPTVQRIRPPSIPLTPDGWYECSLADLLKEFGPLLRQGGPMPFEPVLLLEQEASVQAEASIQIVQAHEPRENPHPAPADDLRMAETIRLRSDLLRDIRHSIRYCGLSPEQLQARLGISPGLFYQITAVAVDPLEFLPASLLHLKAQLDELKASIPVVVPFKQNEG